MRKTAISSAGARLLPAECRGTEGVRHDSRLHGLMQRLGSFVGHESRLPFDLDEVLSEAPQAIYRMLGQEGALRLETPVDFNRFPRQRQEHVFGWLEQIR